MQASEINFYKNSNLLRLNTIKMIFNGPTRTGHIASSLSLGEIVNYLFKYKIFPNKKKRNFLVLSKGHAAPILYLAYKNAGFVSSKDIKTFRSYGSKLQGHPDKRRLKILDSGSGALGQGLSISIGYALSAKLNKTNQKSYCIVGDGELQEGQIWEAAMYAGSKKINNLCAIIDANRFQNEFLVKRTLNIENIKEKWKSFGWNFVTIDGHNFQHLRKAFNKFKKSKKPFLIYAKTIKGKGISFMENNNFWHSGIMKKEHFDTAVAELKKQIKSNKMK